MQNIEVKARCDDFAYVREAIKTLGGVWHQALDQRDVYFAVARGRLKLRDFGDGSGQLIYYLRDDAGEPRLSDYHIYTTKNPAVLEQVLSQAHGVRAVVEKRREVHLIRNVRVHLDEVSKLGRFLELEAVLGAGSDLAEETATVHHLLQQFRISPQAIVPQSYLELLAPPA